jgi:glutamate-1-semialdehyde 2,1-aminomutase
MLTRVGAMSTLFFHPGPLRCWDDVARSDTARYGALFRHLLSRGIYIAPSQFEATMLSTAHSDADIDRTVETVAEHLGG